MRYALTVVSDPNAYDWGDTDTIVFEYPTTLPEGKALNRLVEEVVAEYGWLASTAAEVANEGWWFIRNTNDVDVVIEKEIK